MKVMKTLGTLTQLTNLNLWGTKITDEGLKFLRTLTQLTKLMSLELA